MTQLKALEVHRRCLEIPYRSCELAEESYGLSCCFDFRGCLSDLAVSTLRTSGHADTVEQGQVEQNFCQEHVAVEALRQTGS